jgi:hypothetical protein
MALRTLIVAATLTLATVGRAAQAPGTPSPASVLEVEEAYGLSGEFYRAVTEAVAAYEESSLKDPALPPLKATFLGVGGRSGGSSSHGWSVADVWLIPLERANAAREAASAEISTVYTRALSDPRAKLGPPARRSGPLPVGTIFVSLSSFRAMQAALEPLRDRSGVPPLCALDITVSPQPSRWRVRIHTEANAACKALTPYQVEYDVSPDDFTLSDATP